MSKLYHNKKLILKDMNYITNSLKLAKGLMFANNFTINKGVCLVFPSKKDVSRFSASVTNIFVFHILDILFVNSDFEVIDKKKLLPWVISYTPKSKCKYVIESSKDKFKDIKIGDKIVLEI